MHLLACDVFTACCAVLLQQSLLQVQLEAPQPVYKSLQTVERSSHLGACLKSCSAGTLCCAQNIYLQLARVASSRAAPTPSTTR